jgi:glycine/sarcosine N-methyltransferase
MSFYDEIAEYYDLIFPLNRAQIDFVKSCIERPYQGKRLLDVGCGTGDLAIELAAEGFEMVAIDSDPEMLLRADRKAQGSVTFQRLDMRGLASFTPRSFDGILCFGNTLVHLTDLSDIESFCIQAKGLLGKGGRLLLQILNYDHILDHHIKALPLIENDTIRFERFYEHEARSGLIGFRTKLTVKGTGREIDNEILLYPLRRGAFEEMLRKAGFTRISVYGDFDRKELRPDSLPLVVEASAE